MSNELRYAIEKSQRQNEIVHVQWSAELHIELVCRAEDYITDESRVDAWGCDDNGDWRVVLDR